MIKSTEDWARDAARVLAEDMLKELISQEKKVGSSAALEMAVNFLCFYTAGVLSLVLSSQVPDAKNKQEKLESIQNHFAAMKASIQNAMAVAFQSSLGQFANRDDLEYYCIIKPVPEPKSKIRN